MVKKETATAVKIATTIKTTAIVKTVIVIAKASKIFRKKVIIIAGEKIVTVATRAIRKSSVASFNKREKCIRINGNTAAFT